MTCYIFSRYLISRVNNLEKIVMILRISRMGTVNESFVISNIDPVLLFFFNFMWVKSRATASSEYYFLKCPCVKVVQSWRASPVRLSCDRRAPPARPSGQHTHHFVVSFWYMVLLLCLTLILYCVPLY